MTRLILVLLSGILSICCLSYVAYAAVFNNNSNIKTVIVLVIGCILAKIWQWLINTDPDVDMHI